MRHCGSERKKNSKAKRKWDGFSVKEKTIILKNISENYWYSGENLGTLRGKLGKFYENIWKSLEMLLGRRYIAMERAILRHSKKEKIPHFVIKGPKNVEINKKTNKLKFLENVEKILKQF